MRNFSIWRHALLALSLLTLSSTALATTQGGAKDKSEQASQAATPSKGKATRAKTRAKTAQAAKSHTPTAERSRQPSSHAPKATAKPSKSAGPKAEAKTDSKKNAAPAARPAPNAAKSAKADGRAAPPRGKTARRAEPKTDQKRAEPPKACTHDPVTIVRGSDNHSESLVLTRCNGRPVDGSLEKLTRLIAPNMPPRTTADTKGKPNRHVTPSLKNLDSGVLSRLQAIASHYPGKTIRIASAFRPMAARSYHQTGRALDLVVNGVSNEDLAAFCRTLPDTGCGYYPNSTFIHLDVRSPGTGHVYWIDASKPGEAPRYVTSWPEKAEGNDKPATPPPGVHSDEHPHQEAATEHAATPSANTPPAQPLTGDLELDSKTDDRK